MALDALKNVDDRLTQDIAEDKGKVRTRCYPPIGHDMTENLLGSAYILLAQGRAGRVKINKVAKRVRNMREEFPFFSRTERT
jgi:hypothetical protein